jgi:hypothetical protein
MIIYTLDYLKTEAEAIAGAWNGEDERFVDGGGISRSDNDAVAAHQLLEKLTELDELIKLLGI